VNDTWGRGGVGVYEKKMATYRSDQFDGTQLQLADVLHKERSDAHGRNLEEEEEEE